MAKIMSVWRHFLRSLSQREVIFLFVIFLLSIVIRWYKLDQFFYFGFEQGRDAAVIRDIVLHHDFRLVGPQTDIPGVFHGAYYYYLFVLPWLVSHGNPLALAFTMVVLSSVTPIVLYFFARDV